MAQKINLKQLPATPFHWPALGNDLTREKVEELTKDWTDEDFDKFREKGYGDYIIEIKSTSNPKTEEKK